MSYRILVTAISKSSSNVAIQTTEIGFSNLNIAEKAVQNFDNKNAYNRQTAGFTGIFYDVVKLY